jgi:hypothetical protein
MADVEWAIHRNRVTGEPEPVDYLDFETYEVSALTPTGPSNHWVAHTLTLENAQLVEQAPALREACEAFVADNTARAKAGADVNWALIHRAQQIVRKTRATAR